MRINSLQIHNFRSIKGLTLPLPSGLTVLVGENNVGKTTIGAAIYKLLLQTAETGDTIDRKEYHYQTQQPLTLSITLELSSEEIHSSLLDPIPPHYWSPADRYSQWREWV